MTTSAEPKRKLLGENWRAQGNNKHAAIAPRPHSASSIKHLQNFTASVPDQDRWSIDNLPDILYVFKSDVPQNKIKKQLPMKPSPWQDGTELRDLSVLPDKISSNVEEFRVEAWMRLDRRIQLQDITDRMHPDF